MQWTIGFIQFPTPCSNDVEDKTTKCAQRSTYRKVQNLPPKCRLPRVDVPDEHNVQVLPATKKNKHVNERDVRPRKPIRGVLKTP